MPSNVAINGLGLTFKGSVGVSTATLPDVCKTPSPGGPVPVPYPNFASQSSLKGGTKSVKVKGKMAAVKGSQYGRSSGDEAGTAGGLKSGVNMKATDWITYSFNVKMDGKNACRHTDKKFHNNQNAADLAGNMDPIKPAGLSPEDSELWDECKDLHDEYKQLQGQEASYRSAEYKALRGRFSGGTATASDQAQLFRIVHHKDLMVAQIAEKRIEYVRKGCDKFDWFNQGTTTSDRRASHEGAISMTQRQLSKLRELKRKL